MGPGVLGPQPGGHGQQRVDITRAGAADPNLGVRHGRESRHGASTLAAWLSGRLAGCVRVPTRGAAARYVPSGRSPVLIVLLIGAPSWCRWSTASWMPLTAYFLWLLVASVLLSFRPLLVVAAVDALAGVAHRLASRRDDGRSGVAIAEFLLAVVLVLYVVGRARSELPSPVSEALLADLKERLQAQGRIPPLPDGWESQSAMLASDGVGYAGDFLVADLREDRQLEVILVDVCGKGTDAGPAALQFAGALGGLIGALPPEQLFHAANDFLLRQNDDESFATAVHLLRRPRERHLPDHQCRPPAGAAPGPAQRRVADRQRPWHGARRADRPRAARQPGQAVRRRGAALLHRRRGRGPHQPHRRRHRLAPADRTGRDRRRVRRRGDTASSARSSVATTTERC